MHFDLRLWRMTSGLRGRIALAILIGLLALAIGIARFAFLGQFLARLFRDAPAAELVIPLVGALAAILLRPWLDHVRTMVAHRTATRVQEALRGRLYDKIVALGPAWFGAERTGGVMLSIIDGVEQLQTFFGQYLPQVTIAACAPLAIFAFMAFWDVPVAAVMLGAALFTLAAPAVVHERTNQTSRVRQDAFKAFGEEFLDAMQGLPTLKAFGQSGSYGRMLADKARALSDSTFLVLGTSILTRGITDLGCAFGAAAALALGAYRVRHGEMSIEALLIVLMAGTEIFRPLRELRTVLHQGLTGQAAAAGINALLDTPITAPAAPSIVIPAKAGTQGQQRDASLDSRFRGNDGSGRGSDDVDRAENVTQHRIRSGELRLSRRPARRASGAFLRHCLRRTRRHRRPQRLGQVHHRPPAAASARSAERRGPHRRPGPARARSAGGAPADRGGGAGHLSVPRNNRGEPAPRLPRRQPRPTSPPPRAPPMRTTSSRLCRTATRR